MRKTLVVLLIAVLTTHSASAATIYLRDKTRIENAKIMEETDSEFHIRRAGENYSIIYSHDTVKKEDVFCIITVAGLIEYPPSLAPSMLPGAADSLTARQFQEAMLRQQIEAQKQQTSALRDIGSVGIIAALAAVSTSIAIWCMYGLMK